MMPTHHTENPNPTHPTPPRFWQVLDSEILNCPLSAMTTLFPEALRPCPKRIEVHNFPPDFFVAVVAAWKFRIISFGSFFKPLLINSGIEISIWCLLGGIRFKWFTKQINLRGLPRHLLNSRCSHCFPISCHLARRIETKLDKKVAVFFWTDYR